MRRRKWVLVIALILTLGFGAPYYIWKITKANEKIRLRLLSKMQMVLDQGSGIRTLSVDLSGLKLQGVVLTPKDSSFSILVKEVRFGYRLRNLIRYGLKPEKVAHEVYFISPTFIVRELPGSIGHDSEVFAVDTTHQMWDILASINRVTLSRGSIFIESANGRQVRIASQVSGYAHIPRLDSAIVRMNGTFLESQDKNLMIDGILNVQKMRPRQIFAKLQSSKAPVELPLLFPKAMQFADGEMEGFATYTPMQGARGEFTIKDASFVLYDSRIQFHNVSFEGNLENRNLLLNGTVGGLHGTPFEINGMVSNLPNPRLDLKLECKKFMFDHFFQQLLPDARLPVHGDAVIQLNAFGPLENPSIESHVVSKNFRLSKIPFKLLEANVSLHDSVLDITGKADQTWGSGSWLELTGGADFRDFEKGFHVDLKTGGDMTSLLPSWLQMQIEGMQGSVDVSAQGWLSDYDGLAKGEFVIHPKEDYPVRINTRLKCRDQKCEVLISSDHSLNVHGSIYHPLTQKIQWDLWAEGLETGFHLFALHPLYRITQQMNLSGSFSGSIYGWESAMKGNQNGAELSISAVALQKQKKRELVIQGGYTNPEGHDLNLESTCSILPDQLVLHQLSIGDFLYFDGTYPVHEKGKFDGELHLINLDLERLHLVFPKLEPYKGLLGGDIQIAGTKGKPNIKGNMKLKDGLFHHVGIFEGDVEGEWDNTGLHQLNLNIRQNDMSILTSEIIRDHDENLNGIIKGQNFELSEMIMAVTGDSVNFSGGGHFQLNVTGPSLYPNFSGYIKLSQGAIGPIKYKDLQANIYDVVNDSTGWQGGLFSISNGWIQRNDNLDIQFHGNIPHHSEQSVDIRIQATGNLLTVLKDNSSIIISTKSDGLLNCRLGGRPANWEISDGDLSIKNGYMDMSQIVDEIEDIYADLHVDPERQFLKVDSIYGKVNDSSFLLSNSPFSGTRSLGEPLYLASLGLQLGELHFHTIGKGLYVHLPGIMHQGDEGWIHFRGKSNSKHFVISGPASNPVFSGILNLRDFSLTYPFVKNDPSSNETFSLDFLDAIDWDLNIIPEKDVHYVRNIHSPLGNVFLDLQVRENYGDFNLRGIIDEDALEVWGHLMSTEGTIDVLDYYFRPEQINFDFPRGVKNPVVSGRAYTTVIDTLGVPSTVYMTLTTIDDVTGYTRAGGTWDNVQFRFSTSNPNLGTNEAELLATLGYSGTSMKDRAYDALGVQVENIVFRPILGPIERSVRRYLGLDIFRVSSMLSRNLFQLQRSREPIYDPWWLLRSTKLTLGKYIAPGFFVTYAGQIHNNTEYYYAVTGMNLRHALSLEYSIRSDLFLEMEYTYDSMLLSDRRVNRRIWLRHVFPF